MNSMTKQQKLDVIYETMADKTLSDGCLLFMTLHPKHIFPYGPCFSFVRHCIDEYTIIGHPVRIGDVLESLHTGDDWHLRDELFRKWSTFRLPIDDQSEECIDFVHSLILLEIALEKSISLK